MAALTDSGVFNGGPDGSLADKCFVLPNDVPVREMDWLRSRVRKMRETEMGTYKKNPKCIRHYFRVTETEEIQIRRDMANADYLSMSKYFRDMVLRKRVTITRVAVTNRTTRNQINDLSAKIERIGVNYNQAVRALHSALNAKVVKGKAAAYYLSLLASLSDEIIKRQEEIIDRVSKMDTNPETIEEQP